MRCYRRSALAWHTADDALRAMRDWEFSTEDALMYFPRILAHDKLRGHFESFAPCGAVAGMLARADESSPVWGPAKLEDAVLRPGYRPTCLVADDRRTRLAMRGVNTLQAGRSVGRIGVKPRTLARGAAGAADWQNFAARRLALFVVNSIAHGTRWVRSADPEVDARRNGVDSNADFLRAARRGGSVSRSTDRGSIFRDMRSAVQLARRRVRTGEFRFLIGFATPGRGISHLRISHSASGSNVQSVSLNRGIWPSSAPRSSSGWRIWLASSSG